MRRTLDLSLAQVAASALAAVVGAVLASQLGVYGTILGAAVVSIGATTGTAVFQHLFRRTGEQLREMKTTPPVVEHSQPADRTVAKAETQVFDPFDPGGDRTRMMARISPPDQGETIAVYRGRSNLKPKSWKVYAITATIVFALAMGTVGVIEMASGKPASHLFDGGAGAKPNTGTSAPADPSRHSSTDSGGGAGGAGNQGGGSASPNPDPSASSSPHPDPSSSANPTPADPTPSPHNSGSGQTGSSSGTSGDAATPQSTPSP